MENPNTHSDVVKCINKAIDYYFDSLDNGVIGLSLAATVERMLIKDKLLTPTVNQLTYDESKQLDRWKHE